MRGGIRLILPLLLFLGLCVMLYLGLGTDPRKLPSVLVGKPIPWFDLRLLDVPPTWPVPEPLSLKLSVGTTAVQPSHLMGQPWVLNVFASWCQACLVEHAHLLELARQGKVRLIGLAYKDTDAATQQWLERHGNPYQLVLQDPLGRLGIDLGVYGVPETFLISKENVILHKEVGPVSSTFSPERFLP